MPEDDVKLPTQEELLEVLEPKTEPKAPEAPVLSEREVQASNFGWKPKDTWVAEGGDPEDWRPAKDFLERGEMIGKIRSLSKESQEFKVALRHVADQNKKIYETGYKQAVTDLTAQRKEALAEGDLVRADELSDKIDLAKEELKKVQQPGPQTNQVDPAFGPWLEQNQWYNNTVMRRWADALAIEYVNINNGQPTADETRDFVAKEVRKEFAHRFPAKTQAAPSPDGNGRAGTTRSQGNSSLSKIESEMPEEHRQIMKTMLKADPKFTKEEYLKMYLNAR